MELYADRTNDGFLKLLAGYYRNTGLLPEKDIRKWVKRKYKQNHPWKDPLTGVAGFVRSNIIRNWDAGVHVWVFKGIPSDQALDALAGAGIELEASRWASAHDCTGRMFWEDARVHTAGDCVWVAQRWGLDV